MKHSERGLEKGGEIPGKMTQRTSELCNLIPVAKLMCSRVDSLSFRKDQALFSLHNFFFKFIPGRFTLGEVNCRLAVSDLLWRLL